MKTNLLLIVLCTGIFFSCSPARQIGKSAKQNVLSEAALQTAHVGISIYDAGAGKYLYNYQGDKYFVPASNTKLATCYAAMKYLGDSLVGLKVSEYKNYIFLSPTGDPTLLHEDFKNHPVYNFLSSIDRMEKPVWLRVNDKEENALGSGWTWSDYDADYMAERSPFPVYGNVVTFGGKVDSLKVMPGYFFVAIKNRFSAPGGYINSVGRLQHSNEFSAYAYGKEPKTIRVPFMTSGLLNLQLLQDSLHTKNQIVPPDSAPPVLFENETPKKYVIHSQPTDSLLKPMMHRSDNFFAEQSLLMVSNEVLDKMNDAKIIDTLLKTDYKDLPQKPRWVDGSGLSRYNLFSPQDFVTILNKMRTDFGMERIKKILPTGNEGTLTNYYKAEHGAIFAKTGTLSGVVSLSGFLYTKKNKLLIFSVLVNNHQASATEVRRAVEKFVEGVYQKY